MKYKKYLYVDINSKILIWARESMGYDIREAAKRIGIKEEKLRKCEQNKEKLTFNQLKKAAKLYNRPINLFFINNLLEEKDVHLFRRIKNGEVINSPQLNYEIRKIMEFRSNLIEIDELTHISENLDWNFIGSLDIKSLQDNLDKDADKIRRWLKIDMNYLRSLKGPRGVFNYYRELIETKGVLVFQVGKVPINIFRGFNISEKPFPVIVLNSKDVFTARIFTMFHELCHILLNNSEICGTAHVDSYNLDNRIETLCSYLAGEILVPKELLFKSKIVENHPKNKMEWSEEEIVELSKLFHVNRDMMLRRLLINNLINNCFYEKKYKISSKEHLNYRQKKDNGTKYEVNYLNRMSKTYINYIFEAYNHRVISFYDAINLLKVKSSDFKKIQSNLDKCDKI